MQFNRWSIDGAVLIRISNITMFFFFVLVYFSSVLISCIYLCLPSVEAGTQRNASVHHRGMDVLIVVFLCLTYLTHWTPL